MKMPSQGKINDYFPQVKSPKPAANGANVEGDPLNDAGATGGSISDASGRDTALALSPRLCPLPLQGALDLLERNLRVCSPPLRSL